MGDLEVRNGSKDSEFWFRGLWVLLRLRGFEGFGVLLCRGLWVLLRLRGF